MTINEQCKQSQLTISQQEIECRFDMLGLEHTELRNLLNYQPLIQNNLNSIVEQFYDKQLQNAEVVALLQDPDVLQHVKDAQSQYIIELFNGVYDEEYANGRLIIGAVHKRIRVEPKLYLTAMRQLKGIIFSTIKDDNGSNIEVDAILTTLDKLFYFDTTLVLDTYINSLINDLKSHYTNDLNEEVAKRTQYLELQVRVDELTCLYNRRMMDESLRKELKLALRRQYDLAVIYIDIDNLKRINDEQGHAKGDEALRNFGSLIRSLIRETDIPCRCGGDEFCIILPDCNHPDAIKMARRIEYEYSMCGPDQTCSTGVAVSTSTHPLDSKLLLLAADELMYQNKKNKKEVDSKGNLNGID
ncbi:GGDEF domain-containing protein [Vibrio kyushuensis]|uniref:GGDEF domain-containing protein n=1 Tax=Vibrio kyushuensis TaxID=2910249 RepID=UPI003D132599